MEDKIKIGGIYEHTKSGNHYKVLAVAKHCDTLEEMVVYEALYENAEGAVWVRPLREWHETVETEMGRGGERIKTEESLFKLID